MKKIVLLSMILVFLTGCTSIKNSSIETIINDSLNSKMTSTNKSRTGYHYYLPKGLNLKTHNNFSETISDQKYLYYLYVDIVSYYHKTNFIYHVNSSSYYSANIKKDNKIGYIEINNYKNNQYLIEIMYNYAKIEVVVYENNIKESVAYAMTILSSVTYNDNVIKNYLDSSTLDSNEEEFDIFEIVGSDNYLEFKEEITTEDGIKDPDYIN